VLLMISATLWSVALITFVVAFVPKLLVARPDGRAG